MGVRRLHSGSRVGFDWFSRSHKGTEGRLLQAGNGERIGAAAGETGVRTAGGVSNVEFGMVVSDGVSLFDGGGRMRSACWRRVRGSVSWYWATTAG